MNVRTNVRLIKMRGYETKEITFAVIIFYHHTQKVNVWGNRIKTNLMASL